MEEITTQQVENTPKKSKMSAENIQSLVAVSIGLIALFISIWQGCEQRRHNRLSVKPILTFDEISQNRRKSIRMSNDGLGPALIKRFTIIENGKVYDANDGNPWNQTNRIKEIDFSEMYYFNKGASIKPNEAYNLLSWDADSIRILDIEILIEYESIYEEGYMVKDAF
jgi:hypothetical protein